MQARRPWHLGCASVCAFFLCIAASARAAEPAVNKAGAPALRIPGGTPWGLAGSHHLLYGRAATRPGLTFAASAGLAYADRLFFPSSQDRLIFSQQTLHVVWTLGRFAEIGVGATAAVGADAVFAGAATSILPVVRAKWNAVSRFGWDGALAASWQAPPLSGSSGVLSPADATYTLQVLASRPVLGRYPAFGTWEYVLNVGFIYDRTGSANAGVTNPVQLFVDGRNLASRISLGTGIAGLLPPLWRTLALGPYLELSSEWAVRTTRFVDNPVRLTAGTKVFFDARHAFEADVGVDARLIGAPRLHGLLAGLPPWAVFLAFSWHSPIAALDPWRRDVLWVVHDAAKAQLVFYGHVHDTNALVLADARVGVGDDANVVIGVDAETGFWQTSPVPVPFAPGEAPVTRDGRVVKAGRVLPVTVSCSAPGFITQRQQVQPPLAGGNVQMDFHLQRKPPTAFLRLRARDVAEGTPVPRTRAFMVSVDEADGTPLDLPKGELRRAMRPGSYTLIVTAPGFEPHRSEITLTDDFELIVNVDLHRKGPTPAPKKVPP